MNTISNNTNAIREYDSIEAAITTLREAYAGRVYDVTTTAGMKDAKVARATVKSYRTGLEKLRKELKADVLTRGRHLDAEAKRISNAIIEIERPIDEMIKTEEERRAVEKEEREKAELLRVAAIQDSIADLRFLLSEYHPSTDIQTAIDRLVAIEITADRFFEFTEQAQEVLDLSIEGARTALDGATTRERLLAEQQQEARETARRLAEERAAREAEEKARSKERAVERAKLLAEQEGREEAEKEIERQKAKAINKQREQEKNDQDRGARDRLEDREQIASCIENRPTVKDPLPTIESELVTVKKALLAAENKIAVALVVAKWKVVLFESHEARAKTYGEQLVKIQKILEGEDERQG